MNTTNKGRKAEKLVAEELRGIGHKIVSFNWRTRYCEIDIISISQGRVYFTEVKYRKSADYGDGFAAITRAKLKQMEFAAEIWLANNNFEGEAVMQAASVVGDPPKLQNIIEI